MKNLFNDYFGFNRQQRNGVFVLVSIVFLLLLLRITYPYFIVADEIVVRDIPVIEKKPDSIISKDTKYKSEEVKQEVPAVFFVFDPNTVTREQLVKLGIKEKTAKRFIKFRTKGFVFKQKEDLKKVYGITPALYAKLEPYILIEPVKKTVTENADKRDNPLAKHEEMITIKSPQSAQRVDLNNADSLQLLSINGIGPSFARRIIKYRGMLGGFLKVDQLKEVYGYTEELFEKTREQFFVSGTEIRKIKISKDDFKTINRHPYFSYELTKSVMQWRKKTIITPTNLREIFNDNELYEKARPYIEFE